jgi:hypothetical protein
MHSSRPLGKCSLKPIAAGRRRLNAALERMRTLVGSLATVLLVACNSGPHREPWHPIDSGCTARAVHETLMWPEDAPISSASFRVAVSPDTGQGPTVMAVIDSGRLVNLGNPDSPPYFLGVVGDSTKSCAVRMTWEQCPSAVRVYETLKRQSLPLGFEFDKPAVILVFHAPTYYVGFSDGQGNHNQWRFYGLRHPLQPVIDDALDTLRPCLEAAKRAFNAF